MSDEFVQRTREEYGVKRTASGAWLCRRCTTVELKDDQLFECASCAEVTKREHQQEQAVQRRRQWEESVRRRCVSSFANVPSWPHLGTAAAFSKVVSEKHLRAFAERWDHSKGSALLLGPSGAGKTSAAARALRRLEADAVAKILEDGASVYGMPPSAAEESLSALSSTLWTKAFELVEALGVYGNELNAPLIVKAKEASILVVDELGPEPAKHIGVIFDIIDRRYERGAPTVGTSGLTKAAFLSRYGDAFFRRLTDGTVGNRLIDVHKAGEG